MPPNIEQNLPFWLPNCGPRGIQTVWNGYWQAPIQDGLGSVRNNALLYSPFGVPDATVEGFAFTGEMRDANGLQFHRARYLNPEIGTFVSIDPFEGLFKQPMSLNGYGYAHANPVNWTDPSGKFVGVLLGAAAVGAVGSLAIWGMAKSGNCGCELQEWANQVGPVRAGVTGATTGVLAGGIMALGVAVGVSAGAVGIAAGVAGVGVSAIDISRNGFNLCNSLNLAASATGILGGVSINGGGGLGGNISGGTSGVAAAAVPAYGGVSVSASTNVTGGVVAGALTGTLIQSGGGGGDSDDQTPLPETKPPGEGGSDVPFSQRELSEAGRAPSKGEFTEAGRALQKHGSREYPDAWDALVNQVTGHGVPGRGDVRGTTLNLNNSGQAVLDYMISEPSSTWTVGRSLSRRIGGVATWEVRLPLTDNRVTRLGVLGGIKTVHLLAF